MSKRKVIFFLVLVVVFVTGICAVSSSAEGDSWTAYSTPEEYFQKTGNEIKEFKESPMLAEKVEQGLLPLRRKTS